MRNIGPAILMEIFWASEILKQLAATAIGAFGARDQMG
jgi:hypothetical protein